MCVLRCGSLWTAYLSSSDTRSSPVSGWSLGNRTHKLTVDFGDVLENTLESIARKKGTSVEDLLQDQVIPEWIGKRHLVNKRLFDERSEFTPNG